MSDVGKIRSIAFKAGRLRSRSFSGVADFFHDYFDAETQWNGAANPTDLYVDLEATRFGAASLVKCTLSSYDVTRLQESSIQVIVPLSGAVRKKVKGGPTVNKAAGAGASVSRLWERSELTVNGGSVLILSVERGKLLESAEQFLKRSFTQEFLADTPPELSSSDEFVQALTRYMISTWTEFSRLAELGIADVLGAEHESLLAKLAAAALFPDVRRALAQPVAAAGAGPARMARDYIAAHSSEPIEIAHIAADLGVSMRALQASFQRHYGCSPRSFLRRRRLDRCRETLLTAPQATITEVALCCGFSDLGSFAAGYREAFGELPSETLRRAHR